MVFWWTKTSFLIHKCLVFSCNVTTPLPHSISLHIYSKDEQSIFMIWMVVLWWCQSPRSSHLYKVTNRALLYYKWLCSNVMVPHAPLIDTTLVRNKHLTTFFLLLPPHPPPLHLYQVLP